MKPLIAANWKMNPILQKEAKELFDSVKKGVRNITSAEVVICPPFVYLPLLKGSKLGAQNVSYEEKGAFTGEISAAMLKDLGVEYVIIGHSERRKYFGETDEIANKKIKKTVGAGLNIIFCIGETEEERSAGKKNEVLERQIKKGLDGIDLPAQAGNLNPPTGGISIAYEPVWAIGTGNNCSVQETKESVDYIRKFIAEDMRVLYGGSVKSENSGAYIKESGANGLLVGGASLSAEEFIKIVKSAE
jgi:triosephosphate isomerase